MSERYLSWNPVNDAEGEFFIVWFEHRPGTGVVLEVEQDEDGPILRITFHGAIAFREHPHDIMMMKWWGCGSFFRVENSDWVEWLRSESQGTVNYDYDHFGVRTIDGCYEVLTCEAPSAKWILRSKSLNPKARSTD